MTYKIRNQRINSHKGLGRKMYRIALILFIWVPCDEGSHLLSSDHNLMRQRKAASGVSSIFEIVGEFTSRLKENFDDKRLTTVEDVGLEVVNSIPLIGDVAAIFHDDETTFEHSVTTLLNNLSRKFEELSNEITYIRDKIIEIAYFSQISVIQKQVAEDIRVIDNCFSDYLDFLRHPIGKAEMYQMFKCYDKFSFVRDLGMF